MQLDFLDRRYSFLSFVAIYHKFMYAVFAASLVLAVFAADLKLSACYELAIAAILALLFNGLLAVGYEMSLRNPDYYTPARRLVVIVTGWLAMLMFAIGLLVGVTQLYWRG